ncbi:MAG: hypothetical protein LUD12_05695 [Lachnospiraceae bacterium]|nr:hypothetical protein [Lachnospiraceae bacterium]
MRLGKLGEQVVLKSRKAFASLSFMGARKADGSEYFAKKTERDRNAKRIRAMENDFSKINIAASEDVRRLAVVLKCSVEDILEF